MLKKIIFSLILFVSPLFANDALACYMVTFNANGGDSTGLLNPAYYNPSTERWYSDSSCARSVNEIAFLPTRKGYQLRGFWNTKLADVSANDTTTGLFVSNDGVVKQPIPKLGTTLYAAWAQDCENNCSLTIGEDGSVTYSQLSNPDCYMVTLDTNNGIFSGKFNDNKLYSMGGNWYTDSMCATEYTGTTELVPSRTGYVFRGFYNSILPDISETTTAANTSSNLCITKNGDATGNCRITETITIYAAWAQDCTVPSNGTCVVTAGTDGGVDYTTTCATGYEPQQDQNTATPSCTRGLECYKIAFDYNGGTSMAAQPSIYKQQGRTGFFSDANCTTAMTTFPTLKLPTRTGYTLRGFYNTDLADVSENASNGNLYATNKGQLTPFATSWTITDGSSTLYAAWAQDCAEVTNGTCILEIGESTGAATYNTSCNNGYAISNGSTANPTCTSNCKVITLKYQTQNSQNNNIEVKTIYHDGTNWCSDSSCGRCGALFVDLFKRPSDDALPAYFSTSGTTTNYTLINTGSIKEITDSNTAYTCSYTDGELNCNVSPSTTTLYAYVFVAPNLAGAVSGGGLLSFSTVATSSKKTVTVSYKSATCSDAATVHFYGIKGDGTYDSVGTAKFYYDTEKWGNSSGTIKTNFAGLGITNSFTNSVTVNGRTYPKGLSAYRAAWVGGEPRTQPTDMIITETTGIVSPDDNPYDIFVTGGANTLPNITAELFSATVPGSAKNVYYVLLYAANCDDPQGTVNHATCELTITPNGGAYYKNQCLSGYEIENMGTDTLPTTAITPFVVDINNTCEI